MAAAIVVMIIGAIAPVAVLSFGIYGAVMYNTFASYVIALLGLYSLSISYECVRGLVDCFRD